MALTEPSIYLFPIMFVYTSHFLLPIRQLPLCLILLVTEIKVVKYILCRIEVTEIRVDEVGIDQVGSKRDLPNALIPYLTDLINMRLQ